MPLFLRPNALPGVESLQAHFTDQNFARHFHDVTCIGIIEAGAGLFYCDGTSYTGLPGQVVCINPGEVHDGRAGDAYGWVHKMLYLETAAFEELLDEPMARDLCFTKALVEEPVVFQTVIALHAACIDAEKGKAHPTVPAGYLIEILERLIGRYGNAAMPKPRCVSDAKRFATACDFFQARLGESFSLGEAAAASGMSKRSLIRLFRNHTGLPPHTYLSQLRVNKAVELLRNGRPAADVAATCGFCDQSHMTRTFRRFLGVTPSRYM